MPSQFSYQFARPYLWQSSRILNILFSFASLLIERISFWLHKSARLNSYAEDVCSFCCCRCDLKKERNENIFNLGFENYPNKCLKKYKKCAREHDK